MNKNEKKTFVCPWWLAYTFDNPLRKLIHPPDKILETYLRPGMTVLDIGCGFGHFSLAMAEMVMDGGKVIAADVQQKMLDKTMSRAAKRGVEQRIIPHLCQHDKLNPGEKLDFVLACNVLHELPNLSAILEEIALNLRPGCLMFVMEPMVHVSSRKFEKEIDTAKNIGFIVIDNPKVKWEHCSLLQIPKV